jgi:hypothetical protein
MNHIDKMGALAFFALGCLLLCSFLPCEFVSASQSVSGILTSDTTWTKANSPYSFSGAVGVAAGVTLTVEAGATVHMNGYYLEVNGTIRAVGTQSDPVTFDYATLEFTQSSRSWNPNTNQGSILENTDFTGEIDINSCSPKINNNVIHGEITLICCASIITNNVIYEDYQTAIHGDGAPIIWNNTLIGAGISVSKSTGYWYVNPPSGSPQIVRNTISGAGLGIKASDGTISDNTIFGCSEGIDVYGDMPLQHNLIYGNTVGIRIYYAKNIVNNTIRDNHIGLEGTNYDVAAQVNYNNIENNAQWNVNMQWANLDTDATHNWWGTTDTSAINQKIYDSKADFHLGTVNINPILTAPDPYAVPDPNAPMPTSTETAESPTDTPIDATHHPEETSPSQTATPTPESGAAGVENPQGLTDMQTAIIMVVIVVIVVLAIIVVSLRKKSHMEPSYQPPAPPEMA